MTPPSTWLRAAALGVVLALAAALALTLDLPSVEVLRAWVEGLGPLGWAAMALGVAAVLLAPVPRSVLSFLVGVVAGFWTGFAVCLLGGLLGALAAFGLGRGLGRPAVARFGARRLARVDRLATDRGFLAVLTGRLVPVVPFVVLSYGAGLTAVRWTPYAAATFIGLVPSTALQVGLGASAPLIVSWASAAAAVPVLAVLAVAGAIVLLRRRRRFRAPAREPVAVPVA
ncbi:TVP38/TMEM64 family protein [Blastococcus sp. PRF04-17]|uniref:TVP38/TMEM64 family protein n=1 Tax=Blastococcus sp. PRF04-17 TaxID=2933797 RepID=UPI001FF6CD0D|nr:VTT domain-containing protein [Blastococcus sp. PRF04-17]UOY03127.1 VTT domain-containing protein [Blastococcus sp. PRF04-17]